MWSAGEGAESRARPAGWALRGASASAWRRGAGRLLGEPAWLAWLGELGVEAGLGARQENCKSPCGARGSVFTSVGNHECFGT